MSFNVNFLGGIPYNPDNLHIPQNDKKGTPNIFQSPASTRILGYSFNQMFAAYWTVRSFEINVTAQVTDTADPLSQFIAGGGTSAGIIGATAGLGSISQPQDGGVGARGYTKIYSKYSKRVRKAREGIINNITQPKFRDLGSQSLDLDENIDPNKLISHIYKPNEGTLCSAGPVHIFSKNNVSVVLDFSDIRYFAFRRSRLYWPNVTINISVPAAGAAFGNTIPQIITPSASIGRGGGLSFINLNVPGIAANLGTTLISSQITTNQIANVTIDIRPGKRCCDRFFWDGKDEERIEDSETKTPREDSKDTCESVCGDEDENLQEGLTGGVYAKRIDKNPV
jgi:hypothetical protein